MTCIVTRISAGKNRGKRLSVARAGIRPTRGIIRSAIFNMLGETIANAAVLDIFAGTGALGIEALARGAQFCVFVDNHCATLIKNVRNLDLQDKILIISQDFRPALKRLRSRKFDIVFIDPPYMKPYLNEALNLLSFYELVAENSIVIAEHTHFNRCIVPVEYTIIKEKRYGDTLVSFLSLSHKKKVQK